MANTNAINLSVGFEGNGKLTNTPDGIDLAISSFQIGTLASQFPGDGILPELDFSGIANPQWVLQKRTLAATTYDLLNLDHATLGLKNPLGIPVQFQIINLFMLVILNHDGIKKLQIGPQGQSNAWPAWFQAVTANFYDTEFWSLCKFNDLVNGIGPQVTGTTNILPVYNPTASPITYGLFIVGQEA